MISRRTAYLKVYRDLDTGPTVGIQVRKLQLQFRRDASSRVPSNRNYIPGIRHYVTRHQLYEHPFDKEVDFWPTVDNNQVINWRIINSWYLSYQSLKEEFKF